MSILLFDKTRIPVRVTLVAFCALACLLSASLAYADDPVSLRYLEGGGYFAGTFANDINWEQKNEPRGPHGGYNTTSSKCITCHSVHGAVADTVGSNVAILRSATGCAYCHTLGAPAAPNGTPDEEIINGTPNGYNPATEHVRVYRASGGKTTRADFNDSDKNVSGHGLGNPDARVRASRAFDGTEYSVALQCSTCHVVHGSATGAWKPADLFGPNEAGDFPTNEYGYKFLRSNPSSAFRKSDDPFNAKVPETVAEAEGFYQGIFNDPEIEFNAVNQFTLSVWCANCHDAALNPGRVPLEGPGGGFSDEETFVVSNDFFNSVHGMVYSSGDVRIDVSLADGYADNVAHTSPMQGLFTEDYTGYTGSMECYSCHRAGLSADGSANVAELNKLSPAQQDVFTDPEKAKCARCHYGYVNYAVDAVRLDDSRNSDFPHTGIGAPKLLGDFTIDGTDPYKNEAITEPIELGTGLNNLRLNICGRCHAFKDSGGPDATHTNDWIEFSRSYHIGDHEFTNWTFNPILGNDILYSPGSGVSP